MTDTDVAPDTAAWRTPHGTSQSVSQNHLAGEVWMLLRRNIREALRSPVIAFIFPVLFPLFAETLVASSYARVSSLESFPIQPYTAYMAPGMMLLAGMMGSGYSATALVLDVQTGFLQRLRLLNVRPSAILLSRIIFDALRVLPAAVVVLLVGLALGARLESGPASVVGLLVMCSAWSVAYGGLFYIVALTTWNPQAPLAMSPLFILLMFTSTAAMPTSLQPGWLASLAHYNPFTYVTEGARALMTGPVTAHALLPAAAVLVVGIALTQGFVIPLFRRAVER
ncbi:ABC transporter permease [Streptomyces sp. So13.3]|uniref:ABC transporter permease n=1 Tax=Streptomyces TaxID=1883 RepID=UPI001107014A|nr:MULTISPECIES: ABC transporter permease [unclassified Streptomyces]MCZ4101605.1 ABC transporter permease [Streptomyces sp. H39-C1]QNA76356.1 ABC transporter permease [Streptomyces sp. So13.3]